MSKPEQDITTVSIRILDREYQVSSPVDEVDELTASARILDERMSEIRDSGKVFGADRIAVMAGLNLSHELLKLRRSESDSRNIIEDRAVDLTQRISAALAEHKQLNL
ncbi:MAG: cell division protein ZapA [Pseudomonadota bacterium]